MAFDIVYDFSKVSTVLEKPIFKMLKISSKLYNIQLNVEVWQDSVEQGHNHESWIWTTTKISACLNLVSVKLLHLNLFKLALLIKDEDLLSEYVKPLYKLFI